MRSLSVFSILISTLALPACQSDAQLLAASQSSAVQTAVARGQFEMNCPQATGQVLSSNMLQPVAYRGVERAEYTVGVEGCGKRETYMVVCQVGSPSCVAAQSRR